MYGIVKRSLNKKFKDFFFVVIVLFSTNQVFSQVNFVDSIRISLQKKPKVIAALSTRHTFIDNVSSPIYNIKAGFSFNNIFSVGCGYAFLKKPYRVDKIVDSAGNNILIPAELKFNYVNFFAEYVFYRTAKWEFSVPLFFGIGSSFLKYNYHNNFIKESKKLVMLYEPVVSGHYKIFPWLGIGGDIGYRLMLVNNKSIDNGFNSPVYGFRTLIFIGDVIKRVKKILPK